MGPAAAVGDSFEPVVLTPFGGWYREAQQYLRKLCHSGDGRSAAVMGAHFEHPAQTWASWSHRAFTMQHVAVAIAKATYVAVRAVAASALAVREGCSVAAAGSFRAVQRPVAVLA